MKPNFALSLSFEGISLLHRVPAGWHSVGFASLEATDLAAELAQMRDFAEQIDPTHLLTKVVIPNEQIRYLVIETGPLPDESMREQRVRLALDGATPYTVDELVYDWTCEGDKTFIAAVAIETLQEAEGFAVEHQFNPISFVATPNQSDFPGEAFFGLTNTARSVLDPSETVARDLQPIKIIGVATLPDPEPDLTPEPIEEPTPERMTEAEKSVTPDVEIEEIPTEQDSIEAIEDIEVALTDAIPDPEPIKPEPETAAPAPTSAQIQDTLDLFDALPQEDDAPIAPPVPAPTFSTIRATRQRDTTEDAKAPTLTGAVRKTVVVNAPTLPVDASAPPPMPDLIAPVTGTPDTANQPNIDRATDGVSPKDIGATLGAPAAAPVPVPPQDAKTSFFSRRDPRLVKPEPKTTANAIPQPHSEKQRMTVFGARKPEDIGGKPRYLGLILTAVLLLFLAAVGAFASIFADTSLSWLFGRSDPVTASLPNPDHVDETEIEGNEATLSDAELAALSREQEPLDTTLVIPDLPPTLSPEEAEARYAATGIWQIAPTPPTSPGLISLDDLYVASIDSRVVQQDAIALAPLAQTRTDLALGEVSTPAAAGTTFALDARGFVIATPEGALTPDGVRVIAGRPPLTPPQTPTRFETSPEVAVDTVLAGFRPRLRPTDLVEQAERSQFGGLTKQEFAGLRPKARPAGLENAIAAAIADAATAVQTAPPVAQNTEAPEQGSQLAIASSVKPKLRPQNLPTEPKQSKNIELASAAAVAPKTVTPKIPSSASVAKQATVKNAIKLNQVNLIGVYGTPSSRRALIRLSNGRYQKVKVGDRVDGGRVSAISESELRYSKGGRDLILKMPRG